jgi:hypothetical protein
VSPESPAPTWTQPAPPPAILPDHVPFAQLVLSLWPGIGLAAFFLAVNATAGIIALLLVDESWPEWLGGLTFFTFITLSYVAQMVVVWAMARRRGMSFKRAVGLNPFPVVSGILVAIAASVVGRLLAGLALLILQALDIRLPPSPTDPTAMFGRGPLSMALILVLLMVVAPFAEEVIFRGVLMGSLQRRYGPSWAILGSGMLFALVHVQISTVVAIVFVGLALGWIAMRYRSIWPSIIAHSLFNGVSAGAILWLRSSGRL